jgi:hypothetical protein
VEEMARVKEEQNRLFLLSVVLYLPDEFFLFRFAWGLTGY